MEVSYTFPSASVVTGEVCANGVPYVTCRAGFAKASVARRYGNDHWARVKNVHPELVLEEIGTRGGKRVGLPGEGSGQTREGAREVNTSLYTQKM